MIARFKFQIAAMLLVGFPACHPNTSHLESKYAASMFGGVENLKFIQTAPIVKAVRLHAPHDSVNNRPDFWKMQDLANYDAGTPVAMTPKQITTLRAILSDSSIDDPDSSKNCIPNFGVRFTFTDGQRLIDVNICYECNLIWTTEAAKTLGGGDFDPAHEKMTFLARAIFPDDKAIQLMPANETERLQFEKKAREARETK